MAGIPLVSDPRLFALDQANSVKGVRTAYSAKDPAEKAAIEFESVMLAQVMDEMFAGIDTDGPFGGGPGEKMFRSLMNEHIAGAIARQGGIGIANAVYKELLRLQEAKKP